MTGYVAMSRRWQDHPLFERDEFSRRDAWAWLIANAAWKPVRVRTASGPVILQRGDLCFSVRFMAAKWLWSKSRVDRFLHLLRAQGMIETRSKIGTAAGQRAGQSENIITICNYDKFQPRPNEAGDGAQTKSGTKAGQQRDKEEAFNKDFPLPPKGKKSFLPSDWQPPPVAELTPKALECARQWPAGAYETVAEGFALYWQSRGTMMADWGATWRGWIIREHWRVMQGARRQDARPGEAKPLYQLMKEGRA